MNINNEEWAKIVKHLCPKCKSVNTVTTDVGEGSDYRITCLSCKFTKCYDGIDS